MTKGKGRHNPEPDVSEQLDEYWLDSLFQSVETSEDFAVFVLALQENAQHYGATWQNSNLNAYLGGIVSYVQRQGPAIDIEVATGDASPWKIVAGILYNSRYSPSGPSDN